MKPMPPANPRYASACAGQTQVCGAAWSASPIAGNPDNAWNVNFNNGNDNNDNKNNANQVRLVRSGQCNGVLPAAPLSFHDLYKAWQSARRRKRPSHNQLAFEAVWLDSLSTLVQRVNSGAWWPSPPVCFITTRPKAREIHAPDFADRVLHHWLVPRLEALWEPDFIFDSFSNRTGKGTHAAVARLQQHMRALQSGSGHGQAHFLQLDIHNFFNSIHRPTLYTQLVGKLEKKGPRHYTADLLHSLRWLCHRLLARAPAAQVQWRATVASYWGHFSHASAHKARRQLCRAHPWLRLWFATPEQVLPGWRQSPQGATRLRHQMQWLREQFPRATVRVQRGMGREELPGHPDEVVWVREAGRLASGLHQRVVAGGRSLRGSKRFSVFSRRLS